MNAYDLVVYTPVIQTVVLYFVFYRHDLRRIIHPYREKLDEGTWMSVLSKLGLADKPPQLMKNIIEFFTKEGGWVLDPFMGVGGTLLGASLCRRNAVGIDISEEYVRTYKEVSKKLGLKEQIAIVEDARNMPIVFEDLIL